VTLSRCVLTFPGVSDLLSGRALARPPRRAVRPWRALGSRFCGPHGAAAVTLVAGLCFGCARPPDDALPRERPRSLTESSPNGPPSLGVADPDAAVTMIPSRHQDPRDLRDSLFGDVPLASWVSDAAPSAEPWASLAHARDALAAGHKSDAISRLQIVTVLPRLESRHHLEAWYVLRQLGVSPPPELAKRVYGVVVEVRLHTGTDVLAAYADHSARYVNYSGAAVIWDAPDHRFDADIQSMLDVGTRIAEVAGTWDQPRRGAPPSDHLRINVLTPGGLHFREAPRDVLSRDPTAGPLVAAATKLMLGLTSLASRK
jgi:hypothetical protein